MVSEDLSIQEAIFITVNCVPLQLCFDRQKRAQKCRCVQLHSILYSSGSKMKPYHELLSCEYFYPSENTGDTRERTFCLCFFFMVVVQSTSEYHRLQNPCVLNFLSGQCYTLPLITDDTVIYILQCGKVCLRGGFIQCVFCPPEFAGKHSGNASDSHSGGTLFEPWLLVSLNPLRRSALIKATPLSSKIPSC